MEEKIVDPRFRKRQTTPKESRFFAPENTSEGKETKHNAIKEKRKKRKGETTIVEERAIDYTSQLTHKD